MRAELGLRGPGSAVWRGEGGVPGGGVEVRYVGRLPRRARFLLSLRMGGWTVEVYRKRGVDAFYVRVTPLGGPPSPAGSPAPSPLPLPSDPAGSWCRYHLILKVVGSPDPGEAASAAAREVGVEGEVEEWEVVVR